MSWVKNYSDPYHRDLKIIQIYGRDLNNFLPKGSLLDYFMLMNSSFLNSHAHLQCDLANLLSSSHLFVYHLDLEFGHVI